MFLHKYKIKCLLLLKTALFLGFTEALKGTLLQFQDGWHVGSQTWWLMTWSHSSVQKSKRPHPGTQILTQITEDGEGKRKRSNAPHMPGVPPLPPPRLGLTIPFIW